MIDLKKLLSRQGLLDMLEHVIRGIGLVHKWIATGFLFIFRGIGRGLSVIPWGFRYAAALAIAALMLAWVWFNGSSLFLMNSLADLETYADRNANRLHLDRTDFGYNMYVRLYQATQQQRTDLAALEKLLSEAENGENATPEQLALVSAISGVETAHLEGAERVLCKDHEEQIHINMHVEKLNGATEDPTVVLVNPTPEQLKLMEELSHSERFQQALADKLIALIMAENRTENSARGTKVQEVTGLRLQHHKAFLEVNVINLPPMETSIIEQIEEKFEEDNTRHINAFGQYAAFREADGKTIVKNQLDKQNEKLRQLTDLENAKDKADLAEKAEAAVLSYKASHGRIRKDEEKAIRDNYAAKFVEKKPQVIEKTSIKGSQISDWYEERFKETKFNSNNLRFEPTLLEILYDNGLTQMLDFYTGTPALAVLLLVLAAAALCIVGAVVAPLRRVAYYAALAGGIAFTAYWLWLIGVVFDMPDQLLETVTKKEIFDSDSRNEMWTDYLWFWLPGAIYSFFLWFPLLLSSAKTYFRIPLGRRELGDVMRDNLTCKTESSGLIRSFYWVVGYYVFFLMLLPALLQSCYLEDEYNIPKGDGGGQVQPQQVKRIKKKKPKKRFVLNPNSAFLFTVPEMPDDILLQEFDEKTESQYQTTGGTFGTGKKGGKPGWPNGMDNGVIRFIRLKYNGGDWDQDMGKGADYNMLLKIKEFAGFNIASDTEAISIDEIEHRFRNKKKKPPFVYITGSKGINLTTKEVKQLRQYLIEDGGLLFADNGGGNFNSSFRNMIRRVLPNHELVDIANDDIIYQQPFFFPNGAPRLFHHSGDRALGVKNNGRWIVFYHQGDINDAWKAGGSGLSEQQQKQAFWLGANVIAYAFGEYLKTVYGDL